MNRFIKIIMDQEMGDNWTSMPFDKANDVNDDLLLLQAVVLDAINLE